MLKPVVILAAIAALFAESSSADAQGLRYGRPVAPYAYGTPVDDVPTPFSNGGSCVQDCPNDVTPCDPVSYKLADRRCNFNQNGPGSVFD